MITRILVATDGSKAAHKAAAYAVDLAKRLKAAMIILNVMDQRSLIARTVPETKRARQKDMPIDDYLKEAALQYADAVKKLCDKRGVEATISIRKGHPVSMIVKEAKRSKANLIVIGSQGGSALSAMVLGSVSYGVIHQVKSIPVLIVR